MGRARLTCNIPISAELGAALDAGRETDRAIDARARLQIHAELFGAEPDPDEAARLDRGVREAAVAEIVAIDAALGETGP
jgi:hypothetical protein